jgi:hypothetical protein
MATATSVSSRLGEYRALRHEIEANILALATSVDGRRFTFQAPLEPLELRAGGYVELETPAGPRLGQLLSLEITSIDAGQVGWSGSVSLSSHVTSRLAAVRCLVVDLGSLATPQEQALAAEAVLERLWRRRSRREPMLIVIDEAHNVCPARPEDGLTALATEHAVRIAAEGRKFGLYLLASTQRPQKVHENVVSQCDNLVLMRMNAAADLAYASDVFSFVHPGLLAQAGAFGLGEALIAGKLSSHPALVRMGARIAEEGGADVPTTWAKITSNG